MRATGLIVQEKIDEAIKDCNKINELPPVPPTNPVCYNRVGAGKWALLVALYSSNRIDGQFDTAVEALFKYTNIELGPSSLSFENIHVSRIHLFDAAIKTDPERLPGILTRLQMEIIDNEKAHPFWKSLASMLIITNSKEVEQVQAYNVIMMHRNTFTLNALQYIDTRLARLPEFNKEHFITCLVQFADRISLVPSSSDIHQFWGRIITFFYIFYDLKHVQQYVDIALKTSKDKDQLLQIAAISNLLLKDFKNCLKYEGQTHMDSIATAHVMLGEENYFKAWQKIASMPDLQEMAPHTAIVHVMNLVAQRERALSEELDLSALQKDWAVFSPVSATDEERLQDFSKALLHPVLQHPLLSFYRYETMKKIALLMFRKQEIQKAFLFLLGIRRSYPALNLPNEQEIYCNTPENEKDFEEYVRVILLMIDQARKEDPSVSLDPFFLHLAELYTQLGIPATASTYLDRCQDKLNRHYLQSRTDNCITLNRAHEALKYANQMIEHPNINKASARITRGKVYLTWEKYEEAKKDFESAKDDPVYGALACVKLAQLHEAVHRDFATAMPLYEKALSAHPAQANFGYARCLYEVGQYQKALEHIELTPVSVGSVFVKAHINYKLKNYEKAISDYSTVIANSHDLQPEAYVWRGKAYYQMNNKEKAMEDFEAAKIVFPDAQKMIDAFLQDPNNK